MYSKLSFKNVKRSVKDYTIYFLTLTFGVCIFYVFNSIESQQAMLEISESQAEMLKNLTQIMGYVSIFISVILGFLIIYANGFLIKRRKKELGIYMTLGMERNKISKILLLETITIGIVSLLVGITLGVFLSQALSVVTAKMFEVNLKSFEFIFSLSALLKSIMYFGIIFIFVMLFNTIAISKYKLIDLIYADKKNQILKVKKLWLSVVIFIISIVCLGFAYYLINKNGMLEINFQFTSSIILGSIGTFLFFMSLSGFLLKVIQSNKRLYLKNLNMFVLRQINSKINTTFISMTLICLMLLVTIGTLSTGIGISNVLTKELENITPYDITFYNYSNEENTITNMKEELDKNGLSIDEYSDRYHSFTIYNSQIQMKELFIDKKNNDNNMFKYIMDSSVDAISESDYNRLMELQNKNTIDVKDDEFAIISNVSETKELFINFIKNNGTIEINGKKFKSYSNLLTNSIENSNIAMNIGTLVLPDDKLDNMKVVKVVLNANYKESIENCEEKIKNNISKVNINSDRYIMSYTKEEIYEENKGISTTVSYLAIYIGLVFLITSAAVLALQQLSESADNVSRYNLLRKIGVEKKMIKKSIFTQIAIYFMMPLSLAIVHSIVGISVANKVVSTFGKINIFTNTLFTAIFIILIYGGYFLATYFGARNIITNKK